MSGYRTPGAGEGQRPSTSRREIMLAVIVAVAILLAWVLTPVVIAQFYSDMVERGQFGDTFGSINALFSGFALAGVVFAILLQRSELRLQREALDAQLEEMTANRTELARAATAQQESQRSLQNTIYATVYKTAYEILQDEKVRHSRRTIYTRRQELTGDPETWREDQTHHMEIICNSFDVVGIMVRLGMLPIDYVVESWGVTLRDLWPTLKPFVDLQRRRRGAATYWSGFEDLVNAASRAQ